MVLTTACAQQRRHRAGGYPRQWGTAGDDDGILWGTDRTLEKVSRGCRLAMHDDVETCSGPRAVVKQNKVRVAVERCSAGGRGYGEPRSHHLAISPDRSPPPRVQFDTFDADVDLSSPRAPGHSQDERQSWRQSVLQPR
jgi:hypothetical protein